MSVTGGPDISENGLVMYLDAANRRSYSSSGTTWTDLSGNNITSTLTNGPTFSSTQGGVITFDGNNDYCMFSTSNFPSGNSAFSIEAWFSYSGAGVNTPPIILGYGVDRVGGNGCPHLAVDNAINKIVLTFGSGTGTVASTFLVSTGVWYHVCGVYTTTQSQLYINGALNNTTNYSAANIDVNNAVNGNFGLLGGLVAAGGSINDGVLRRYGTFNGNIGKISVYNRALSATETLQNFNATRSRFNV